MDFLVWIDPPMCEPLRHIILGLSRGMRRMEDENQKLWAIVKRLWGVLYHI